jgi:cytochrome c oxidase subunit 3
MSFVFLNPYVNVIISRNDLSFVNYRKSHPFHILSNSPWPFLISLASLYLVCGFVFFLHEYSYSDFVFFFGFVLFFFVLLLWFRDVIRESTFEGCHTYKVQSGLKVGMVLFIISEVMLFISFFWAFFHFSLSPSIFIGCIWPPSSLYLIDFFSVPLWNTWILLSSGVTLTLSHHTIRDNFFFESILTLALTIFLGFIFTLAQLLEYFHTSFDISDGVYGSVFFMLTGLHGAHVIIGTVMLFVSLCRFVLIHFSSAHHLGFEFSAWYWHFVDVVWIVVYLFVYLWSSL